MKRRLEEGSPCPCFRCDGTLQLPPVEDCSCHLSAPCYAHETNQPACTDCGWTEFQEVASVATPTPAYAYPTYAPTDHRPVRPTSHFTEVIYSNVQRCAGTPSPIYYALSAFHSAENSFPYTVAGIDDFGDLFFSHRSDLYEVSYHSSGHTNASMLVTGWYPPHLTREEVRAVVNGTFGGRFTEFANGRYTFIAYTD